MKQRHDINAGGFHWQLLYDQETGELLVRFVEGPSGETAIAVEPQGTNMVNLRPAS